MNFKFEVFVVCLVTENQSTLFSTLQVILILRRPRPYASLSSDLDLSLMLYFLAPSLY